MDAENSQFIERELLQQKQSKLNLFKTEGCEMCLLYGGLLANDPLLV